MTEWQQATAWEAGWWGQCLNTHEEERKASEYMRFMGLQGFWWNGQDPTYDFQGQSVVDMGGGPVSVLLKGINRGKSLVVDPCSYPDWVSARYAAAGIEFRRQKGEEWCEPGQYDVGLLYNVLQHVEDPERIVMNLRRSCRLIRVFEWLDIPKCDGHIQVLTEAGMNEWFGATGFVDVHRYTRCWFGTFAGGGV